MAERWFAIMTAPRAEETAKENLEWKGYRVFFPHWGVFKKRRYINVPYFSRYIFVAFDGKPHQSAYDVNETDGVSTMVYAGSDAQGYRRPFPIPEQFMQELHELCHPWTGQILQKAEKQHPPEIVQGIRVRVTSETNAAFNFLGEVERRMGKLARVKLEKPILGKSYATFDLADLQIDTGLLRSA